MASLQSKPPLLLCLSSLMLLLMISPSHALKCTSQTFNNSKQYAKCTDLPYLNAFLHWTYTPSNSSLSIAYIAPPAKPGGWVAWAINPTAKGMVGSQALLTFEQPDGTMAVNTYNISSYRLPAKSAIAYDVTDTSAEYSDGVMRMFATLALPGKTKSVNRVWQVGGSVTDGSVPVRHELQTANLNSMGTLVL